MFTPLTASGGSLVVREEERRRHEVFKCERAVSFLACAVAGLAAGLAGISRQPLGAGGL